LFGPDQDKSCFYVFDYCQNLEFFSQDLPGTEGYVADSLNKRLFGARLELIGALDERLSLPSEESAGAVQESRDPYNGPATDRDVRVELAERLRNQIAGMNPSNFLVRPKRRLVEKFSRKEAWDVLKGQEAGELMKEVAGLPSEFVDDEEEAKRFDLLMFRLQLALLKAEPAYERLRSQVREIAGLLEEKDSIPMVREQMALIQEIQTDEYWQDINIPMLENSRRRLRGLVKLIDKVKRKMIYTDFEDSIGQSVSVQLPGFVTPGVNLDRFRAKARQFLRAHTDLAAVHKLRLNLPLSTVDLNDLEKVLTESGVGTAEELELAKRESQGLGIFVRSLVGLDRETAKRAFNSFLSDKAMNATQIEFINLIIDHLTEYGIMDPTLLYKSPFTDLNSKGPEGIFPSGRIDEILALLSNVHKHAIV
jgi:type I restriction enzyme, R subunit